MAQVVASISSDRNAIDVNIKRWLEEKGLSREHLPEPHSEQAHNLATAKSLNPDELMRYLQETKPTLWS